MTKPIRLFWGENYADKPREVRDAMTRAFKLSQETIHLYPGALYEETAQIIMKQWGVKREQLIFGHGTESLIHVTTDAFLSKGGIGGMLTPSFFVFDTNLSRVKSVKYPCTINQKINFDDFSKFIQQTDLFYIASPNTGTGNYLFTRDQLISLLKSYKGILVVDECYYGLGDVTVLDLIDTYPNLIVYRTVSKIMGMASLRFGMAFSQKQNIDKLRYYLNDIELDPINSPPLYVVRETFQHYDLMAKITKKFLGDFLVFLKNQFPEAAFIETITTFSYMDISRYKNNAAHVNQHMNENGYLFSASLNAGDNEEMKKLIELTPPPQEYWEDFVRVLRDALTK